MKHRYLSTGFHIYSWIVSQRTSIDALLAFWSIRKRNERRINCCHILFERIETLMGLSVFRSRTFVSSVCLITWWVYNSRAKNYQSSSNAASRVSCVVRISSPFARHTVEFEGLTPSNRQCTIILSSSRINETEQRSHHQPVARRIPMKMLQSLNALAGKISPGSPTDSNANKVHMHNNNNNNNNVHHHPYSKQAQPSPSHSANGDQKENTWVFFIIFILCNITFILKKFCCIFAFFVKRFKLIIIFFKEILRW